MILASGTAINQYSGKIANNINTSKVFDGLGDNVDGGTYNGAGNARQPNRFDGTKPAAGDNTIAINDPNINFSVAGFGTGDKIQLGKDMANYNIVGIETAGSGIKINLIDDDEATFTITVGSLNVGADNSDRTTDGDISAYVENITESGAMLIDGKIVYAEAHNQPLCALKGLDIDNAYFDDNTLVLTADSFSGNEISVVSNGGDVTFLPAGFDENLEPVPLTGKTFTANGGKIILTAYDITVDVTNGNNAIEIDLPVIFFNVTGFGAGDTIKLGDEMKSAA